VNLGPHWSIKTCYLAVLALVLLTLAAVPVLAADPSAEEAVGEPSAETDAAGIPMPSAEEVQEAIERAQREEVARDEWLESPEAVRRRQSSQSAFDHLSGGEAAGTLAAVFAEELEQLDGDPARTLSDLEIEEVVGGHGALVADGEGGKELVESPIPIRSQVPGEEGETVDLDLKQSEGGFVSKTPATEVSLPATLGGQIEIGQELAIASLPGDGEISASRFGDKDLFFANVATDTDTFIAPLTRGVEIFQQLRSAESPEEFRYGLALPQGTLLRSDGQGGAEVIDAEGRRVAFLPAPLATDAQGAEVPVSMTVEGNSVIAEVAHRSMDVAYPLLVDPELVTDAWYWEGGNTFGLAYWGWQESADYEGGNWCVGTCWGYGLYARSKGSNYWYGPNTAGQWVYSAPNTTAYIRSATFWTLHGDVHNCPTYQPHGYVGIYNVYSGYNSLGVYSPPSFYASSFETGAVGSSGTRYAVVGIGTGSAASQLSCGHDFFVGGVMVSQDDPEQPAASASGMPEGWISNSTPAFTITANGYDPGLGVKKITLSRDGSSNSLERPVGCSGTAASRCPENRAEYFNVSALSFDEGQNNAVVTVEDATGKKSSQTWQTYVDITKPDVTLSGQLAAVTEEDEGAEQGDKEVEELSLPVYNLSVKATDIGTESDANKRKRSGVRKIEILLDGVKKEAWEQPCSDSCSMEKGYSLKLGGLDPGRHVLEVIAVDGVKNPRERSIEFEYFPATGMKDEYVMQRFPLPDGKDHSEEEVSSGPELAVNVMNGNLVYREQDVEVEGAAVDLEVERFYNSQLPEAEDTEWGDGWTLAQTPELDPVKAGGSQAPNEAEVLESSGAIEGGVGLPTSAGSAKFDPGLQATLTKRQSGGYELTDETGESATSVAFDTTGQAEALLTDGYAKVDYDYEGGSLSEIEVQDPGATSLTPEEMESLIEEEGEGEGEEIPPTFSGRTTAATGFPGIVDVAVDDAGNTWALSRAYARVLCYGPSGGLASYFGWPGSQPGGLSSPSGIAVDEEGFIWVADSGNHRIQKFRYDGTPISRFGYQGTEEGALSQPYDVAIDGQGDVWVADSGNSRLQEFSPTGEFLGAYGSKGSAEGQLLYPLSLDVGPEGDIWVADTFNDRLQKLSPDGEHLLIAEASIPKPEGVTVEADGEVWVSSSSANAVWHLGPGGEELGRFGSYGSGEGLELSSPHGLTADSEGRLFIADANNNRVVRWALGPSAPDPIIVGLGAYGAQGPGEGEMSSPSSIDAGAQGEVWVADTAHSRIQHFDSKGELLGTVGSEGAAPGELYYPMGLAAGSEGDVWVADTGNYRIQHFDAEGDQLGELGSVGEGPGEFSNVVAVATGPEGDLWALDAGNYRVQHFDAEGNYLGQFGEYGEEEGQLMFPSGLAVGPDGSVWVADAGTMRVQQFGPQGKYRRNLDLGEEPLPTGVEVDEEGDVWVAEGYGERIRGFSAAGLEIARFDSESEGYELSLPYDVAVGPGGDVWGLGLSNSRVQRFHAIKLSAPRTNFDLPADDPSVEIETDDGLVSSLQGEEAGEHTYEHEGDFLVSHDGPEGETVYEYDEAGRMTRVELANGTWAEIEYGATDGRVIKVIVDPEGPEPEKTTQFSYVDAPQRSTTVVLPNDPKITYEIGEDGSVLKWQNAKEPPEFEVFAGTLVDVQNKETPTPINVGDYELKVTGYAEEGMESVQIYANGNQLIREKHCPAEELCKKLPDEWVTYTGDHAPGILSIEAIIEDRLGQVASKRFWVNIPYTPPPAEGQPAIPRFAQVMRFREEHGLDLDLDHVQDEFEINDRVFDSISAWVRGDPVATESWERWGVPLRQQDVAELEYRIAYWREAVSAIPAWAEANASSTFAGYYLDERAGGLMRVGFTSNQSGNVDSLKSGVSLPAEDRIAPFAIQPNHSLASLRSLANQVSAAGASNPAAKIYRVGAASETNQIRVGSSAVGTATSFLQSQFGAGAPISVYEAGPVAAMSGRERITGKMLGGERISTKGSSGLESECTTGFGAFEYGTKPADGSEVLRLFALTAAHCGALNSSVIRAIPPYEKEDRKRAGFIRRHGFDQHQTSIRPLDVTAVKLEGNIEPRRVYISFYGPPLAVRGWGVAGPGTRLCHSGATTDEVKCGPITTQEPESYIQCEIDEETGGCEGPEIPLRQWCFDAPIRGGDSGGPVWIEGTNTAFGINSSGSGRTCAAAIAFDERYPDMASVFSDPSMGSLDGLTTTLTGG
jgi:YD repeat-containing protein